MSLLHNKKIDSWIKYYAGLDFKIEEDMMRNQYRINVSHRPTKLQVSSILNAYELPSADSELCTSIMIRHLDIAKEQLLKEIATTKYDPGRFYKYDYRPHSDDEYPYFNTSSKSENKKIIKEDLTKVEDYGLF